jgi:hypothetical protein
VRVHSLNRFHAVGHGTFFTGDLSLDDGQRFRWGFDCGSKRPNVIQGITKRLASEAGQKAIDLFCLSHFDADHVNGLKELLQEWRIHNLALPYLPFDLRLAQAARVDASPSAHEVALFLLDPVRYIGLIAPDNLVETIVLIKGGKGPASDEGSADGPLFGPEPPHDQDNKRRDGVNHGWTDDSYPNLLGSSGPRVVVRDHSDPIQLGTFWWEFVFFNRSLPKGLTPKSGVKIFDVQEEVRALLDGVPLGPSLPAARISALLSALKGCYDKHFGNSASARNNISLCVFSGAVGSVIAEPCKIFDLPYQGTGFAHTVVPFGFGRKTGLLLTGDILLRSKIRDRMTKHFGYQRWDNIHLMQIPHHGSKHSWQTGLAAGLSHAVSVFCVPDSNPKGQHPHSAVLMDLQKTTSVLANYSQVVMHAFHVIDIGTAISQIKPRRRQLDL